MNSKQFQILKTIYYNTLEKRYCNIKSESLNQGKKFYKRVKELENMGHILVFREPGESNLYRLTDAGLLHVVSNIPYPQIMKPV